MLDTNCFRRLVLVINSQTFYTNPDKYNPILAWGLSADKYILATQLTRIILKKLRYLSILYTLLLICSCSDSQPSDPMCRIDESFYEDISANAACVIRVNNLLLTLELDDRYSLVVGQNKETEAAQCTAHRAMWETTGFNVVAGKLLDVAADGTRYYQCELAGNFDGEITEFPLPAWSQSRADRALLQDPFVLQPQQWQSPEQLIQVRDMFNHIQ